MVLRCLKFKRYAALRSELEGFKRLERDNLDMALKDLEPRVLSRKDPLIPPYLEHKHIDNHDAGRHEKHVGDYHASKLSSCQRKVKWEYERGKDPQASPYFDLGNIHENYYGNGMPDEEIGGPLRHEYGAERVTQDVGCTIFLPNPVPQGENDYIRIVGEADWLVFDSAENVRGHVCVLPSGVGDSKRTAIDSWDEESQGYPDLETALSWEEYDNSVELVIETKTTKKLEYLDTYNKRGYQLKHRYQLAVYQRAFDCPGELTYIIRNDQTERNYHVPQDSAVWAALVGRTMLHHSNMLSDSIPETDPLPESGECKFCPYSEECKKVGGSVWD